MNGRTCALDASAEQHRVGPSHRGIRDELDIRPMRIFSSSCKARKSVNDARAPRLFASLVLYYPTLRFKCGARVVSAAMRERERTHIANASVLRCWVVLLVICDDVLLQLLRFLPPSGIGRVINEPLSSHGSPAQIHLQWNLTSTLQRIPSYEPDIKVPANTNANTCGITLGMVVMIYSLNSRFCVSLH